MKKRNLGIVIAFGWVLILMFFSNNSHNTVSAQRQTVMETTPAEIILDILNSHTRWQTLQGEATVTWYGPLNETQTYLMSFGLSQPVSGYIQTTSKEENGNDGIWLSNGENIYELNSVEKTFIQGSLPAFVKDTSHLPLSSEGVRRDMPVPHPFAMFISSPLRDLIYPTEFIQSADLSNLRVIGEETVLNRKTWVMVRVDSSVDYSKVWIDRTTGIFLRYEQYMNGEKWMDLFFNNIEVDSFLNPARFEMPSGYHPVIIP